MQRNMTTEKTESARTRRGGLGLRFWNFLDRASIGPSSAGDSRRTGARV